MRKKYLLLYICLLVTFCHGNAQSKQKKKPNILFICVDDLRRELGVYGSEVITPNIDGLAADGSLFLNHYAQVPTSGASRACMLTGYLPKNKSDLSNEACKIRLSDREEGDEPETLFHQLKRNGYYTVGIGKISHYADGYLYGYSKPKSCKLELPYSWNEMLFDAGKWETGWNAFFGYSDGSNRQNRNREVKPYECADVPDDGYPDGLTANLAVNKLKELLNKKQPFCLAVGFFKPHLPFTAPKKYWDMYDEKKLLLSPTPDLPSGCSKLGFHNSDEFNGYLLGEEKASLDKRMSDVYARKLRHAYYACISYVDAQIGKLLNVLKDTGEFDNTIIVLWGDHGWHLGDHRIWGKHTLYETALGSALIIKAPMMKKGVRNERIVSSIDIYPTLLDLCGVQHPKGLDGHSLTELLSDPEKASWKDVSYSYFNNGVSVRVPQYRLIQFWNGNDSVLELYRYKKDLFERKNMNEDKIVKSILPILRKGFINTAF